MAPPVVAILEHGIAPMRHTRVEIKGASIEAKGRAVDRTAAFEALVERFPEWEKEISARLPPKA